MCKTGCGSKFITIDQVRRTFGKLVKLGFVLRQDWKKSNKISFFRRFSIYLVLFSQWFRILNKTYILTCQCHMSKKCGPVKIILHNFRKHFSSCFVENMAFFSGRSYPQMQNLHQETDNLQVCRFHQGWFYGEHMRKDISQNLYLLESTWWSYPMHK